MSSAAISYPSEVTYGKSETNKTSQVSFKQTKNSPAQNKVIFPAFLMIVLQICDGVLTAIGISLFGTSAEGNLIIRALMETLGYIPALVLLKTIAVLVIFSLVLLAEKVKWIPLALKGLILVYLFAAIIPWCIILYQHI